MTVTAEHKHTRALVAAVGSGHADCKRTRRDVSRKIDQIITE